MALLDVATLDRFIKDQPMMLNWMTGIQVMNPLSATKIAYTDDYADVSAFGDITRQRIPLRAKPRGVEVEDGIFVERIEVADPMHYGRSVRYRADFSQWPGDKEGVYIPDAGRCAEKAGIDTILHYELDTEVMRRRHTYDPKDMEVEAVRHLVKTGKRQLTDKLLEVMGTNRTDVMDEHYSNMKNLRMGEWPGYGDNADPLQHAIIPRGVHEGFWDKQSADLKRAARERDMRRRELDEIARVRREDLKARKQLEELAEEEAEIAAVEANEFFGAWG